MRLIKLVKLSWFTSQGTQVKYFSKPSDAKLYSERLNLAGVHQQECVALQDDDNTFSLLHLSKISVEAPQQATLLQFWQPQRPAWPTAPQRSASGDDPMDIVQPGVSCTSSSYTGYSSF